MLYLSLVLSAIVLRAAHTTAQPAPYPVRWGQFLVCGFGFTVAPVAVGLLPLPSFGLFLLLGVALLEWPCARQRGRMFFAFSAVAVLIAYGLAGGIA